MIQSQAILALKSIVNISKNVKIRLHNQLKTSIKNNNRYELLKFIINFCILVPIEYPDYQNHEELDIEIEKTEAEMECSKSNSKISIASADSGHQPSDPEESDIKKSKGKLLLFR